ncbi:hypothetical protein GCM10018781_06140 [Kitasatospora indigofera]|uniref:Uncharacterized protein n=1 Tax=Kitasatospora indigofera TaxID=67307 RepID=A0A919FC64_9ACTN|nr:hypothetical protein [Kitasatospora indigofera]GHH60802.1 hypothetical protein GCM10018781_06140 [Kitasatospora indigofera]
MAAAQAAEIVVRVAHGTQPEGDLRAAVASLDLWLERESTGQGSAERRLGDPEQRRRTKSGELFTELCFRVAEGVAVEALYATVRAAVTAWRRHWRRTHGADQEVEVEVVRPADAPAPAEDAGDAAPPAEDGTGPTDGGATDRA